MQIKTINENWPNHIAFTRCYAPFILAYVARLSCDLQKTLRDS